MTKNTKVTKAQAQDMHEDVLKATRSLSNARQAFTKAVNALKSSEAWKALGHKSWTDYLSATFTAETFPNMPKKDLDLVVGMLGVEGVSSRVIAEVTGVSQSTANRTAKKARAEAAAKGAKVETKVTAKNGQRHDTKKAPATEAPDTVGTAPAIKAAKAYAAAVKRLAESGDFDLAALDPKVAAEVAEIVKGTRSDMVRATKALDMSLKVLKAAA